MKEDVLSVKATVEEVLAADSRARSNDTWLIFRVLQKQGFKVFIPFEAIDSMPAFESITRCRRKLQEEGKYSASEKTQEERAKEAEAMRKISGWF
jgi:hypothetical protein